MATIPAYLKPRSPLLGGTLENIRSRAAEVRDLQLANAELEERIKQNNIRIYELTRVILPEMFNEARVPRLTLEAEGNMPAFEAKREPYFRANISADWSAERREAAFDYLTKIKAGDLIRNAITSWFGPRTAKQQKTTLKFLAGLKGVDYEAKRSVPWGSLTSWLRAEVESGHVPNLDIIGGDIGQIVKLKPVKGGLDE